MFNTQTRELSYNYPFPTFNSAAHFVAKVNKT